MSHLWTGGYPRNTSNGDYGRFMFTSNQNSGNNQNQSQGNFEVYPSADGNRMVHHAHYPNCHNNKNGQPQVTGGNGSNGSNGMPEYTIEYGEDAVRAALGGEMPDFQAQYMKQVNGANQSNGNGVAVNPQNIQMMNNGKSRVAMIPVVFDDRGDDEEQQRSHEGTNNNSTTGDASEQESNVNVQPQIRNPVGNTTGSETSQARSIKPPKQENIINAYNSVRKVRSTGQVKYGRHIRPSYWNPQVPNPCRKKMGSGDFLPELPKCFDELKGVPVMPSPQEMNISDVNGNGMMMMENGMMQQGVQPPPQRTRSMPPKKHIRPTNSLCGKCSKCKNLSSNQGETPVLGFPTYSPGTRRTTDSRNLSSSNLGQSAKNFRAIRFSST